MKVLICGKGGCGKSTVAALLAAEMAQRGKQVLLVDADESNIGLYRMLGVEPPQPLMDSLGGKKGFSEKTKSSGITLGGPPRLFPESLKPADLPEPCVAISGQVRVMSVGKIHHFGEGCACPMGRLFSMVFSSLTLGAEDLVIVDTAAGVEHFGRRLDGQCDHLFCVVDPSYESIKMAERVTGLAKEAQLPLSIILNKMTPEVESHIDETLVADTIIARLPDNREIFLDTLKGKALNTKVSGLDPVCLAIEKMME